MAKGIRNTKVTVRGSLDWRDQLAAAHLGRKTSIDWLASLVWILYIAVVGFFAIAAPSFATVFFFALFLGLSVFLKYYPPMRQRKRFATDPELSANFEVTFSNAGIARQTDFENSQIEWALVKMWRSDKNTMLVYISDNRVLILPKRFLTRLNQFDRISAFFKQRKIRFYDGPIWATLFGIGFFLFLISLMVWPVIERLIN